MPTRAESAITAATVETDSRGADRGARVFLKPPVGNRRERPQFRVTPTSGGYFLEESVDAGGRFWTKRAYMLTASEISADDFPDYVWEEREKRAARQADAWAALAKHKIPVTTPLADFQDHEEAEVREAAETLAGLRWLLVWPADAVAEHIDAYRRQWGASDEE